MDGNSLQTVHVVRITVASLRTGYDGANAAIVALVLPLLIVGSYLMGMVSP